MFDEWQMKCNKLLKADPIESDHSKYFNDKLRVEENSNPDTKLLISLSTNEQIDKNQEQDNQEPTLESSPSYHCKKVLAKVDCGRYKEWNKENQNKGL